LEKHAGKAGMAEWRRRQEMQEAGRNSNSTVMEEARQSELKGNGRKENR